MVKLIAEEQESEALVRALESWPDRAVSAIAEVEVGRVARAAAIDRDRVIRLFAGLSVLPLTDRHLRDAVDVDPLAIRSLDAIHLAAAGSVGEQLGVLVSYDRRMLSSAREAGIETASPA